MGLNREKEVGTALEGLSDVSLNALDSTGADRFIVHRFGWQMPGICR